MDDVDPDKKLTGGEKVFLSAIGHLMGGGIVSTKRWERRLMGAGVMLSNSAMQQHKLLVYTRWTVPAAPGGQRPGAPWFVDVIEYRFDQNSDRSLKSLGGNTVKLKVGVADGKKITLQLLKTEVKGLKAQKTWTKHLNSQPCEAITFVGEHEIVPLEIVARIERTASNIEALEVAKRFNKEWLVPMVQ